MENLLSNKYCPKTIDQFVYPESIKKTISELIRLDELSFLLYGNRGSGKSTMIRSIVKEYFQGHPRQSENILNINNVSDQGINYFRNDVKLFCQTNSTIPRKKKIIIFDDFDQINDQCQQVFRNYIDKYGNKIGFIFSTSNLHKIVNSIQSRFLVIELQKPSYQDVKQLCNEIVQTENIKINDKTIDAIIDLTQNTIHDIYNYLEKIKLMDTDIEEYDIGDILTHINYKHFRNYFEEIEKNNLHRAQNILITLFNNGHSVIDILDDIFHFVKSTTILTEKQKYILFPIISKYITIFYDIHEHEIELIFFTNNIIKHFHPTKEETNKLLI